MKQKKAASKIRIVAGHWRGRQVSVPDAPGLRPTLDRVRETLFNWLMFNTQGARCLDLFAGSGALGLEALSRGAESAVFVDSNSLACSAIRDNLALLKIDDTPARGEVIQGDALQLLGAAAKGPFDIVFLDPPFDLDIISQASQKLSELHCLSAGALVYLEWRRKNPTPEVPDSWQLRRSGSAGESAYALYEAG